MFLECAYDCKDVYELQEYYFPKNKLNELIEALEFCGGCNDEYCEVKAFLAGIEYQKEKNKRRNDAK